MTQVVVSDPAKHFKSYTYTVRCMTFISTDSKNPFHTLAGINAEESEFDEERSRS